jgi:hypothetical protein
MPLASQGEWVWCPALGSVGSDVACWSWVDEAGGATGILKLRYSISCGFGLAQPLCKKRGKDCDPTLPAKTREGWGTRMSGGNHNPAWTHPSHKNKNVARVGAPSVLAHSDWRWAGEGRGAQ